MLCAMFTSVLPAVGRGAGDNPCLQAEDASAKQMDVLLKTKKERRRIFDPAKLPPWIAKVKAQSKQARAGTDAALEVCDADEQLGQRARKAAISRLKKRLRILAETDKQMLMMQGFETDPYPRIDPSVIELLEDAGSSPAKGK